MDTYLPSQTPQQPALLGKNTTMMDGILEALKSLLGLHTAEALVRKYLDGSYKNNPITKALVDDIAMPLSSLGFSMPPTGLLHDRQPQQLWNGEEPRLIEPYRHNDGTSEPAAPIPNFGTTGNPYEEVVPNPNWMYRAPQEQVYRVTV